MKDAFFMASLSIKKKKICQKIFQFFLEQVWFASVFAPSSAAAGSL
jgi:hypothetical protein